jgi:long-chain acyl-CoA synthetase
MAVYCVETEKKLFAALLDEHATIFASKNPLRQLFINKTLQFSQDTALILDERRVSYAQFAREVSARASYLHSCGIGVNAKIILFLSNSLDFYFWYHAIHAVGGIAILVSTLLHEKEVERIFDQAQPQAIIFSKQPFVHVFIERNQQIFGVDVANFSAEGVGSFVDGCVVKDIHSAAVILYTSGSTGEARGVVLSAFNILTNALQTQARFDILKLGRSRMLSILPQSHSFAHMTTVCKPLLSGDCVYVVPQVSRTEIKKAFRVGRPTIVFGVPMLFALFASIPDLAVHGVKLFVSGGDFLSPSVEELFMSVFARRIASGYGLSEASPVVALNVNVSRLKPSIINPLFIGILYKIKYHDSLPEGVGELLLAGDTVFMGYFSGDLDRLDKPIEDGWFATGDLVRETVEGLELVGRLKNIIVFKGFNIYPEEIERVLAQASGVFKVAVFGLEHSIYGEVPVAVVEVFPGALVEQNDLLNFCKQRLAAYKIPHRFVLMDKLPLSSFGKIDKRTVKKIIS